MTITKITPKDRQTVLVSANMGLVRIGRSLPCVLPQTVEIDIGENSCENRFRLTLTSDDMALLNQEFDLHEP